MDHEGAMSSTITRQVIQDFDDINKTKSKPTYARAVSG